MSEIIEILTFIVITTNSIFQATDSVYLGDISILDIAVSLMYLQITLWGVFTLISHRKTTSTLED